MTMAESNSLWEMDPLATKTEVSFDMDLSDVNYGNGPLQELNSQPMAQSGDTSVAHNSLWQLDPLAKCETGDITDMSVCKMDPFDDVIEAIPNASEPLSHDKVNSVSEDQGDLVKTGRESEVMSLSLHMVNTSTSSVEDAQVTVSEDKPVDNCNINKTEHNSCTTVQTNGNKIGCAEEMSSEAVNCSNRNDKSEDNRDGISLLEPSILQKTEPSPEKSETFHMMDSGLSGDNQNDSTVASLNSSLGSENSHYVTSFTSPDTLKLQESSVMDQKDICMVEQRIPQESEMSSYQKSTEDLLTATTTKSITSKTLNSSGFQNTSSETSDSVQTDTFLTQQSFSPQLKQSSNSKPNFPHNPDVVLTMKSEITDEDNAIKMFKEQLKNKDRDLQLAAEIGKQLLENNTELKTQLEDMMKEMSGKVEALEQEKYSLQLRLDQRAKMEENYAEEVDNLKAALHRQRQEHEEFVEAEHNNRVIELKNQLRSQQTELEQSQMSCRQLEERTVQLEGLLQDARDQLEHKINVMNETCSEELAQMQTEINSLQNDKIVLDRELNEARNREERFEHSLQRALAQVEAKDQEIEERQSQATSYYNSLEKAREEIQDLKVELDVLRMETQDRRAKGNSLFSEVEDRRVQAEKELISLKVQLDSLNKQYKITRQHEHTLKLQLSVLLQKAGHTADVQHMERLQQMLAQSRSEVTVLTQKLQQLDKQPQQKNPKAELYDAWCKDVYKNDPTRMQFFEKLLESKEKEIESLKAELKTKRMLLLAEDQKVLKYEGLLYDTQRQLEKQRDCNIKLKLKVDELKMKYEPDRSTSGEVIKGNVEKIPLSKQDKGKDGKENKPVTIKDAKPKDGGKAKVMATEKSKLDDISIPCKPKPLSKADTTGKTQKPILKSLQKKSVRLSEDIDFIEPEKSEEPTGTVSEDKDKIVNEGQKQKGRVRGRERYNQVNMVKMEGKEEVGCNQQ